ncbi:DUF2339 domain-containing protein [Peribacillus kribbensis]|uniref:DUF2339 domain-containing protein n=1 Tax=Peribacillus kribbensis TaxID=356658 RepID=UPI000411894E|nr:DUF2339 domain-containing protein [Peribacillus kribbensis]
MNLEQRVEELEERVRLLEGELREKKNPTMSVTPVKAEKRPEKALTSIQNPVAQRILSKPLEKENGDYEKMITQVWLPRIFILVLLAGVIWGFKAASNYGIINPKIKSVLGYIISAVLIWLGYRQFPNKREVLGQVLLGGSIALLMLTTFAMTNLYMLISSNTAFFINILWIAAGIYFTIHFKSQALGLLSVIGGFLVPFLIGSKTGNAFVFTGYETILYLAFLYIAMKYRYIVLYFASAILLNMVLLIYAVIGSGDLETGRLLASAVIIQHIFLLAALLLRNRFMLQQAGAVLASFAVTYAWVRGEFQHTGISVFLLASLLLYVIIGYTSYKRKQETIGSTAITTALAAMLFYIVYAVDQDANGLFLLMEGTLAIYLSSRLRSKLQLITGFLVFLIGCCLTFTADIQNILSIETLSWLIFFAAAFFIWHYYVQKRTFKTDDKTILSILAGGAVSLLGLYFLTQETSIAAEDLSINGQHMILSLIWSLYAASLILAGLLRKIKMARYLGIGYLLLTLLKLIFLDIPSVSIMIRAILFIGLGTLGLIISRLFYQKS